MAVNSRLWLISYSQELVDGQPVLVFSNSLPIKASKFEPVGHSFHSVALKLLGCEKKEDEGIEDQKVFNQKEQSYMPSSDSYSTKVRVLRLKMKAMGFSFNVSNDNKDSFAMADLAAALNDGDRKDLLML